MKAYLYIRTGPNDGEIHALARPVAIFGRGADCDVRLNDPYVSRQHFRIEQRGENYWMFDLGSANCTAINGMPKKERELKHGDEIHVGSTRILFLTGSTPIGGGGMSSVSGVTLVFTKRFQGGAQFEMIGSSQEMAHVFELVERVAPLDTTVLIYGESGTGKELVAQALHHSGKRPHGPMVTVNCAAIPRELTESELFGHEKGAFTGAHAQRLGKFELADGGTLFLDEIAELPLEGQAKLLRVLEEHKFSRVGGEHECKVDVRVVAATHQDLAGMVQRGQFRQDLLYRLEVVSLKVPSLRERNNDIELLARHFLDQFGQKVGRRIDSISPEAMEKLKSHPWPGNVRELKNVIERAVILGKKPIVQPEDIFLSQRSGMQEAAEGIGANAPMIPLDELFVRVARPHIERALHLANGNKSKAAELLGIPRSSLYDIARKYGVQLP